MQHLSLPGQSRQRPCDVFHSLCPSSPYCLSLSPHLTGPALASSLLVSVLLCYMSNLYENLCWSQSDFDMTSQPAPAGYILAQQHNLLRPLGLPSMQFSSGFCNICHLRCSKNICRMNQDV